VTNFKNPEHGFCAEGSHVADWRAIFENFSWFERSFDFSEHENAQFRDERFFNNSQTHTQLKEMADFFMDRSLICRFGMGGGLGHDRIEQPRKAKTIKFS
jgi:hypothetical protein